MITYNYYNTFKFINLGRGILESQKHIRYSGLPSFFWYNFFNNEVKYGRVLTRDAAALCGHTAYSVLSPRQMTTFTATSYFFNPKFKFGFIFNQMVSNYETSLNLPIGKKFKIGAHSNTVNFLEEQKSNYFLHYTYRNGAFNSHLIYSNFGAQLVELLPSKLPWTYQEAGRVFFSPNARELREFFLKKGLSRRNRSKGVYLGSTTYSHFLKKTGFFWAYPRFSIKLKKFKRWAVRKREKIRTVLFKGADAMKTIKKRKTRRFFKNLVRYYHQFKKTRNRIYFNRSQVKNDVGGPRRRNRRPAPAYAKWGIRLARRRKVSTGTSIYGWGKSRRNDVYGVLRALKNSTALSKERFRKKVHRRPVARNARKAVTPW